MLKLYLLGPPRVEVDNTPVDIQRRKALALLIYLAVNRQPHSRDTLATLFYPEQDQKRARAYLRRDLASLNTSLPGEWLAADREVVEFKFGDDVWLDVVQFHQQITACQTHPHPANEACSDCLPLLAEAMDLYQADFLTGFTLQDTPEFDEWQYFEAESLRQELALALEKLGHGYSAQKDYEAAIPYIRRWLTLDPLHEPAQQALMQFYHQAGQSSAALRQYELYAQLLEDELGLPPGEETVTLYEAIKANRLLGPSRYVRNLAREAVNEEPQPEPVSATQPRHHLPAQSIPFVARERELAEIGQLLANPNRRLITLVGPGGIGKTRLGLAAAEATKNNFPHGAHFAPLAPLQTANHIASTLAESLDIRFYSQDEPKQAVLNYLASRHLLLVMDNFEHLLAGVNLVAEILQAAPQVTVLATSRERLNLSGETIVAVSGMTYPILVSAPASATADTSLQETTSYSAVRLLRQQARLARPDFELEGDDLTEAVHICQLVQGMPLAIVLAAGWLEMLSLREIKEEIARSLDFLETEMHDVPDRQRSMRAVFDSSWGRLTEQEQAIFMKLSIFRGGFTRQAAEAVAGAKLRELRTLVNKTFVTHIQDDRGSGDRYEIHELLRQYGQEMLCKSGLDNETRQAHSEYFLNFVRRSEIDLRGRAQAEGMREVEADFENIRVAWDWALTCKNEASIGAAVEGLHLFCDMRGLHAVGIDFLSRSREALTPTSDTPPSQAWGKILTRLCLMQAATVISLDSIEADAETCLAIAEHYEDEAEIALCLYMQGCFQLYGHQAPAKAIDLLEQSLARYRALDDRFYAARVLSWIGNCQNIFSGANIEPYMRESLELSRQVGSKCDMAIQISNLAEAAFVAGRYAEGYNSCQEVIRLTTELDFRLAKIFAGCLSSLGHLLQGDLKEAEQNLQSAITMYTENDYVILQTFLMAVNSILAALQGDDQASQQYGCHSLATSNGDPFYLFLANWGLSLSYCNQQDFSKARSYLQEAFDVASHFDSLATQTWLLPVMAIIMADEGEKEQALELLALATCHPLSPTGWHACWSLLTQLQTSLEAEFGPEAYQAIWARGKKLDLEATAAEWLTPNPT